MRYGSIDALPREETSAKNLRMKQQPAIIVRLVHIDGPFKGNIDEFFESHLTIGRHPSCSVSFPQDQTLISRMHADLVREGNRFKVIDHSTNGTFVNGKKIEEAYLKDGDVIIIGSGGPKLSFLTETKDPRQIPPAPPSPETRKEPARDPIPTPRPRPAAPRLDPGAGIKSAPPSAQPRAQTPAPGDEPVPTVQVPLVIQYGPTIQSYKQLPVAIGKNPECEFVINHPHIIDRHVLVFFLKDHYWVKDLSGQNLVTVNGTPVPGQTPLQSGSELGLSSQGPVFKLIDGGRLVEVESPVFNEAQGKQAPADPLFAGAPRPARSGRRIWIAVGVIFLLILMAVFLALWFLPDSSEILARLKATITRTMTGLIDGLGSLIDEYF